MINFTLHKGKLEGNRILVSFNDKIEFTSKNYDSRVACLNMINVLRKNFQCEDAYVIKQLSCGSWLFELKNIKDNAILGRSNTYTCPADLQKKIKFLKICAPNAKFNSESLSQQAS